MWNAHKFVCGPDSFITVHRSSSPYAVDFMVAMHYANAWSRELRREGRRVTLTIYADEKDQ